MQSSVRASQETHYFSATEHKRIMLLGETVAVYCENHTEHINTLCGPNAEFWCVKAGGPLGFKELKYVKGTY
jgi:hypothetical protein